MFEKSCPLEYNRKNCLKYHASCMLVSEISCVVHAILASKNKFTCMVLDKILCQNKTRNNLNFSLISFFNLILNCIFHLKRLELFKIKLRSNS